MENIFQNTDCNPGDRRIFGPQAAQRFFVGRSFRADSKNVPPASPERHRPGKKPSGLSLKQARPDLENAT